MIKKLSILLNETYNAKNVVDILDEFFSQNFQINKTNVYILDTDSKSLREFSKNWIPVKNLSYLSDFFERLYDKNYLIENGLLYYGLFKHNKLIGMLEFSGPHNDNLVPFLDIVSSQISLKIQNIILSSRMQKNIDFHDAMKNIAKIIETQYEINYIIPIIGEIIDKLISEHLIYIFLKEEHSNKLLLAWPGHCLDSKIYEQIKDLSSASDFRITKKIGVFPLINDRELLGAIVTKSTDCDLNDKEIDHLKQLSNQAAITINRANVYAEILKNATLDALTSFYNRDQLDKRIKQETASARRQKTSLCAIMADIDFFKQINDTYGHAAGDYVLKTIASIIRTQLREYDIAGRYGGEEFAILLPFTKIDEASMVAERLRKSVENKVMNISKINPDTQNKNINVTISLGVYQFKFNDSENDLLNNADKALYEAKETGRNKVIIYKEK